MVPVLQPLDEQRHFLRGTGHAAIVRDQEQVPYISFLM
jgi:hypothetical protein